MALISFIFSRRFPIASTVSTRNQQLIFVHGMTQDTENENWIEYE
jgi:hypothetical protein